jgi:hypothetical protein
MPVPLRQSVGATADRPVKYPHLEVSDRTAIWALLDLSCDRKNERSYRNLLMTAPGQEIIFCQSQQSK